MDQSSVPAARKDAGGAESSLKQPPRLPIDFDGDGREWLGQQRTERLAAPDNIFKQQGRKILELRAVALGKLSSFF